jgi:hypothetical protein
MNSTTFTPTSTGSLAGTSGTSTPGLSGTASSSPTADMAGSASSAPDLASDLSTSDGSTGSPSYQPRSTSGSTSLWQSVKDFDNQRESLPGEHLMTLAAGAILFMASGRSRSLLFRTLGPIIGGALMMRAASGRDGLEKLVRYLPLR